MNIEYDDIIRILIIAASIGLLSTMWKWCAKYFSFRLERTESAQGACAHLRLIFDNRDDGYVVYDGKDKVVYHPSEDKFTIQSHGLHRVSRRSALTLLWSDKYGLPPGHYRRLRNSKIRTAIMKTTNKRGDKK